MCIQALRLLGVFYDLNDAVDAQTEAADSEHECHDLRSNYKRRVDESFQREGEMIPTRAGNTTAIMRAHTRMMTDCFLQRRSAQAIPLTYGGCGGADGRLEQ